MHGNEVTYKLIFSVWRVVLLCEKTHAYLRKPRFDQISTVFLISVFNIATYPPSAMTQPV